MRSTASDDRRLASGKAALALHICAASLAACVESTMQAIQSDPLLVSNNPPSTCAIELELNFARALEMSTIARARMRV